MRGFVLAAGLGTRLRPLTEQVPKPMVAVADMPLVERAVRQLVRAGITEIGINLYYLPEMIVEHLGDGPSLIHRDQGVPFFIVGRVQAHRQIVRMILARQSMNLGNDANSAHAHSRLCNAQAAAISEDSQGLDDAVIVVQRLAHSHQDQIAQARFTVGA